jgi:hypothetical protein
MNFAGTIIAILEVTIPIDFAGMEALLEVTPPYGLCWNESNTRSLRE